MIFNYPDKYFEFYKNAKDGFTFKNWIAQTELLSTSVVNSNVDINFLAFKKKFPDWDISYLNNTYLVSKNNKKKIPEEQITILKSIGKWDHINCCWEIPTGMMESFLYRDDINKFKGDMLEVFSEMFFNIFKADEAVGITDYAPVEIDSDYGVDATGINVNGHQCAIQVKYRQNPLDLISYADIARTFTSAALQLNMSDVVNHDHTVYLFTSSGGVSAAFDKVMGRKCIVINRSVISTKVDNNITFWNECFNLLSRTLDNSLLHK